MPFLFSFEQFLKLKERLKMVLYLLGSSVEDLIKAIHLDKPQTRWFICSSEESNEIVIAILSEYIDFTIAFKLNIENRFAFVSGSHWENPYINNELEWPQSFNDADVAFIKSYLRFI